MYMPPGRKPRVSARTFAQYATHGVGGGWGGVGMMTFLALAHMVDATQVMGWGGMMTFLALAHMVDATQVMGWGGVGWGWADDVPCTCNFDLARMVDATQQMVGWCGV